MNPARIISMAAPRGLALGLASAAWLLPALMSRSTAPAPNHPRVLLWYKSLRQSSLEAARRGDSVGLDRHRDLSGHRSLPPLAQAGEPRSQCFAGMARNQCDRHRAAGVGSFSASAACPSAPSRLPDFSGPARLTSRRHATRIRRRRPKACHWWRGSRSRPFSLPPSGAGIDRGRSTLSRFVGCRGALRSGPERQPGRRVQVRLLYVSRAVGPQTSTVTAAILAKALTHNAAPRHRAACCAKETVCTCRCSRASVARSTSSTRGSSATRGTGTWTCFFSRRSRSGALHSGRWRWSTCRTVIRWCVLRTLNSILIRPPARW